MSADAGTGRGRGTAEAEATPSAAPTPSPEVRSWGWHVMALSSWLLLIMLPIHVLTTWVFHDPGHFGVALYVDRWHHGYWRLFDGVLVVVALVHGGIGLDSVLATLTRGRAARRAVTVGVAVVLGAVGLLAVSTIVAFNLS